MAERPSISLIVVAKNEEELIGQCLSSASFCNEQIVIDSFSTDRTVEIARELGAKVFQREWAGYVEQKQFALEQASGEWVLLLDADEQASWELKEEIEKLLSGAVQEDGFRIQRVLYHLEHYFTGNLYGDFPVRLFRRSGSHIGGRNPHDKVVVKGTVAQLRSPILHFSYRDIADHVATINRFTTVAASEFEPGRFVAFKMFANPLVRFFKFYVLRGGFRQGGRGLYAAMTAAFYVFLKYAKLYERRLKAYRQE